MGGQDVSSQAVKSFLQHFLSPKPSSGVGSLCVVRRVGVESASQWTIYRDITEQSTGVITQTVFVFCHDTCVCLSLLRRIAFDI